MSYVLPSCHVTRFECQCDISRAGRVAFWLRSGPGRRQGGACGVGQDMARHDVSGISTNTELS